MRNGMFDCFEFARTTVCQTEIRLSDIFDFPRRSSRFNDFPDRATWLLLALKAPFCRVTGTILPIAILIPARHEFDAVMRGRQRQAHGFHRKVVQGNRSMSLLQAYAHSTIW